ncbi:MAG: glycosyltransferase [Candidatus Lokiarchaeota archaeon]|nr:glycosyltransferase [Candidatus Lokiarchaeota archaeon]
MNKKLPLVSVITLTYNHEKYIRSCIESVLRQTYKNIEHIIIDDGSTDDTKNIINLFLKKYKRIKYFRQKNIGLKGIGKNYNKALSISKGKYIAILEGDDYWDIKKLQIQVNRMESENSILCYSRAYTIDEKNNISDWYPKDYLFPNVNIQRNIPIGEFLKLYLFKSIIPSPTIMIKSDVLKEIGGFSQPSYMRTVDYPTVLNLSLKGKFSYINEPIAFYRVHLNQATLGNEVPFDSAARYALEFYAALPDNLKVYLGISERNLDKHIGIRRALNEFHRGRFFLIQGNFKIARRYFIKMFRNSSCKAKLKALFGIIFSFLHHDIEWAARLTGRRFLK